MNSKPIISFDLWKTLIFSHPDFKRYRTLCLFTECNHSPNSQQIDNLIADFSILEKSLDKYQIDWSGIQPEASYIEEQVLNLLHQYDIHITFRKFLSLQFEALQKYPPTWHPHLPTWLGLLKDQYDLVLISNTMFIPGLHLYLTLRDLLNYFDVLRFSDEVGHGKPGIQIAKNIVGIKYHVGDTIETDGVFAHRVGAGFLHVTDTDNVIDIIDQFLNKK